MCTVVNIQFSSKRIFHIRFIYGLWLCISALSAHCSSLTNLDASLKELYRGAGEILMTSGFLMSLCVE